MKFNRSWSSLIGLGQLSDCLRSVVSTVYVVLGSGSRHFSRLRRLSAFIDKMPLDDDDSTWSVQLRAIFASRRSARPIFSIRL